MGWSEDGWYSEDFQIFQIGELGRLTQSVAKARAAGVRCAELCLDFRDSFSNSSNNEIWKEARPIPWLSELVFWAASLAVGETILTFMPEDLVEQTSLIEAIDRSVGVQRKQTFSLAACILFVSFETPSGLKIKAETFSSLDAPILFSP